MDEEVGRSLRDGLSQQAAEPEVSAVPASIPSAAPWWKCVQCGHREYRDAGFKKIRAPMIRCCACGEIHSAPDPDGPQALRWRVGELTARIAAAMAILQSRRDELQSRYDAALIAALTRDSDGSQEGEKPQALSAKHESAGPKDIARV